ncbi:MAG: hypothetical protein RLY86_1669 [Pseudomonadota bacterium]|jgi:predicted Zn-dependent protease
MGALSKRLSVLGVVWALALGLAIQPAMAQRQQQMQFIRDTEIEQTLRTYATPLLQSAGIVPEAVNIVLIQSNEMNAFVAAGQNIFWFTGMLMDTTIEELIGVKAHEIGHIAGGHLARGRNAMEEAGTIAMLSTLIGIAAAIGAGRSDVGMGVIGGGQEAARRTYLAYSRTQEGSADEFAFTHLEKVGWPATGLMTLMERMMDQTLLPQTRQVEYLLTHPLQSNRVEAARNFITNRSKHTNSRFPEHFYDLHARMQAKLMGFVRPQVALRRYGPEVQDIPGRYARAIALYRTGSVTESLGMMDGLIGAEPRNPFFHELKGQILFENGRAAEAVPPYREAIRLRPESGLIRASLGHALLEVGDDRLLNEAIEHLLTAARLERRSAFTWRLLASAYSRADMQPQLAYARAEEALARGDIVAARFHADKAEQMLPHGSPEWLRAQDIRVLIDENRMQRRG